MDQGGIALPMHDALIVPRSWADRTREAIVRASKERLGQPLRVTVSEANAYRRQGVKKSDTSAHLVKISTADKVSINRTHTPGLPDKFRSAAPSLWAINEGAQDRRSIITTTSAGSNRLTLKRIKGQNDQFQIPRSNH